MKRLLQWMALAAALTPAAWPKVVVAFRLASPPLPVEAGQQFSLCAANVGTRDVDVNLEFVNVRTGAVVTSRLVTLPPPGTSGSMPDPCLATTADAILAAGAPPAGEPALVVGVVVVRRGLFAPPSAATAAVQVTAPDAGGGRRLLASIPLHSATMINGRNTPIEVVH
jgi:hypothetical protein